MKKLVIAAVLAVFALAAQAAKELVDGYTWEYTVANGEATVTGVEPLEGDIVVPSCLGNVPVKTLGRWAFNPAESQSGSRIRSVCLPEGLREIGFGVFYCRYARVNIPSTVKKIEAHAFSGSTVTEWRMSDGVNIDATYTFSFGVSIQRLVILGSDLHNCASIADKCESFTCGKHCAGKAASIFGYSKFAGYLDDAPEVEIVSSSMRADDPTVMDVVYKVYSSKPQVKVRAIAYKDGVRSLANAIRPTKWIDGTEANVGDAIRTGVEHKLSWRIAGDWGTDLSKVKMEVLAVEDDILPLELQTIPQTSTHAKMKISWNKLTDTKVFDALLWLYASGEEDLTLVNGQLKVGTAVVADGTAIKTTTGTFSSYYDDNGNYIGYHTLYTKSAVEYVLGKMGYQVLAGDDLTYARRVTQLDLPVSGVQQYAVKKY